MDRAREKDVMIYAVGLQVEYFNGQQRVRSSPDRGLKKLAEDTGGGYFELKKTADLGETFTRVAQELHSQYVLGFSPETLDGKVHKLEVRVKKAGMNARARKTYVAAVSRNARLSSLSPYTSAMRTVTASRNATSRSALLEMSQSM